MSKGTSSQCECGAEGRRSASDRGQSLDEDLASDDSVHTTFIRLWINPLMIKMVSFPADYRMNES